MESINDIISRELKIANYSCCSDRFWHHSVYADYWLVVQHIGPFNIEELQEKCYADLEQERLIFPDSDKNTSLLILNQVESKNRDIVVSVEDNSFYFKKYVIQYTEEEIARCLDYINGQPRISLGKILLNPDLFSEIKRNLNNPMSLLYTIAHKLPFVMMEVEKKTYSIDTNIILSKPGLSSLLEWVDLQPLPVGKNVSPEDLAGMKSSISQFLNIDCHE